MTISLDSDCRARVVAQMLFMRYTEHTAYRVENGVLLFSRKTGVTRWPYSFVSDKLIVSEAANEQHQYTRMDGGRRGSDTK